VNERELTSLRCKLQLLEWTDLVEVIARLVGSDDAENVASRVRGIMNELEQEARRELGLPSTGSGGSDV
jgi:hypothetical protein